MSLAHVLALVSAVRSSPLMDNGKQWRCGGPLPYVKQDELPEFESSKYTAADPTTFKPFKVYFVLPSIISHEFQGVLHNITTTVNQRLSAVLKAPPLHEIRRARWWNRNAGRCADAVCGGTLAGEHCLPCQHPITGSIIEEDDVPVRATAHVDGLNKRNDISLVAYVYLLSTDECDINSTVLAFAAMCQVDPSTLRPTHGYVTICANSPALKTEKAPLIVLHEVMHIVTAGTVVGFRSPAFGCAATGANEHLPFRCENITYKAMQQEWMHANGSSTNRTQFLATMPNVKRAAQEHFGCASVEGAEVEVSIVDESGVTFPDGAPVPIGTVYLQGHWSERLFPDELLAPLALGSMRLSTLTLGLLMDLDWYEVNMSAAEPIDQTRPKQGGCDIAKKSCHQVISKTRDATRGRITQVGVLGPYCDDAYGNKDRVTFPMCTNDSQQPLDCAHLPEMTEGCAIILRPLYDALDCKRASTQPEGATEIGGTVGPGTICSTLEVEVPDRTVLGVCVGHSCDRHARTLSLILKPNGKSTCRIDCPADKSNQLIQSNFSSSHNCTWRHISVISVICPHFDVVCAAPRESSTTTTAPTTVSMKGPTTTTTKGTTMKRPTTTTMDATTATTMEATTTTITTTKESTTGIRTTPTSTGVSLHYCWLIDMLRLVLLVHWA